MADKQEDTPEMKRQKAYDKARGSFRAKKRRLMKRIRNAEAILGRSDSDRDWNARLTIDAATRAIAKQTHDLEEMRRKL